MKTNYRYWSPEEEACLREDYPTKGPHHVCASLRRTYAQVTTKAAKLRLRYDGYGMAGANTRRQKYPPCDVEYFDRWSPNSAYLLGYIWADGCVRYVSRGGVIQFEAQKGDGLSLFPRIRKELGCRSGKISVTRGRGYSTKPVVRFNVCSKQLVDCLVQKHGVLPNKTSLDLPLPKHIPADLFAHFVRGYFDGDGIQVVRRPKDRRLVDLAAGVCGQPLFVAELAVKLSETLGSPTPRVTKRNPLYARFEFRSRNDVHKLFRLLYADYPLLPHLHLPRRLHWFEAHLPTKGIA